MEEADVVSILEFFKDLPDPRCSINRKHLLGEIMVICISAVLCGADGPKAIGMWALSKKDWLKKVLELPCGIPSHDTFGRVLATVKPSAFQECFAKGIGQLRSAQVPTDAAAVKHLAIDGKALRRSHDQRKKKSNHQTEARADCRIEVTP